MNPWERKHDSTDEISAQRAYVEAVTTGLGFTAHGDGWHWYDPKTGIIHSRKIVGFRLSGEIHETQAESGIEWIDQAAKWTGEIRKL